MARHRLHRIAKAEGSTRSGYRRPLSPVIEDTPISAPPRKWRTPEGLSPFVKTENALHSLTEIAAAHQQQRVSLAYEDILATREDFDMAAVDIAPWERTSSLFAEASQIAA